MKDTEEYYKSIRENGASAEVIEELWDDFATIPKSRNFKIKKKLLWWPRWTKERDIYYWFDENYPGGIRELMRKRMNRLYGPSAWEEAQEWLNFRPNISQFLNVVPELARTREFQKERHSN